MFRGRLSSPQHRNVKLAPSYLVVGVGVSDPAGNASMLDPCCLASSFPRTDSAPGQPSSLMFKRGCFCNSTQHSCGTKIYINGCNKYGILFGLCHESLVEVPSGLTGPAMVEAFDACSGQLLRMAHGMAAVRGGALCLELHCLAPSTTTSSPPQGPASTALPIRATSYQDLIYVQLVYWSSQQFYIQYSPSVNHKH